MREGEHFYDVAIDATLRAALIRQVGNGDQDSFCVHPHDLRKKLFKRPRHTLIVIVVDASDSMGQGTFARMKAAKGAALAILSKARLKRHRVAMVAFWDKTAEIVLQPTASLALAQQHLKALPTGGATPFADGLMKAWQVVKTERHKDPDVKPVLVVISDGEANVPYDGHQKSMTVMEELLLICQSMAQDNIHAIAIDTKPLMESADDMQMIAKALNATYHHITHLRAKNLVQFLSDANYHE